MAMQYTGRPLSELWNSCEAEYRFYKNSLRNFRPGPGATTVADLGEYLLLGDNEPKQSISDNLPAMCILDEDARFTFPDNLDTVLAADTAWAVEYVGRPQFRGATEATYHAIIGEGGAASPYFGLTTDNRFVAHLGTVQNTSDQICWWWHDAVIHLVFTKTSTGTGLLVYANNSLTTIAGVGTDGFTDAAGQIFNHIDDNGDEHPMWGHHFLLRFYSTYLVPSEVYELYQDAQRLLPHYLWHIPVYSNI